MDHESYIYIIYTFFLGNEHPFASYWGVNGRGKRFWPIKHRMGQEYDMLYSGSSPTKVGIKPATFLDIINHTGCIWWGHLAMQLTVHDMVNIWKKSTTPLGRLHRWWYEESSQNHLKFQNGELLWCSHTYTYIYIYIHNSRYMIYYLLGCFLYASYVLLLCLLGA